MTNADAFGRARIASPTTLFDSVSQYNEAPLLWETTNTGTGALSHLPAEAAVQLSTGGTASGSGRAGLLGRLLLTLDAAGTGQDRLSVVATSLAGTANVGAAVNWRELY